MNNERMIKTEFHLHTAETSPCGMVPGAELVRALADAGYGAVITTDHYITGMFDSLETRGLFLKGYHAARNAGEALGVTVLPGMEFRFAGAENDFLVYGMEEADFAALPETLCRYSLPDFHAYCREHEFLLFQAHPFRSWCKVQNPAFLDGVEVWNGNVRQVNNNPLALHFAREHNLLEVAGGDVHQLVDVRPQGMQVPQSLLTPKGIVQFLRTRPPVGEAYAALFQE